MQQPLPTLWSRIAAAAPPPPRCNRFCCSDFAKYEDALVDFQPSLANDIHPLFGRGQFPPGTEYEALEPALRLATRLLSLDSASAHIATMAYGSMRVRVGNADMEVDYGFLDGLRDEEGEAIWPHVSRHHRPEQSMEVMRQQASTLLTNAKDMIRFHFVPLDAAGKTLAIDGPLTDRMAAKFPRGCRSNVHIQESTYTALLKHKTHHASGAEALLDHFHLAILLLHELGHALTNASSGIRKSEFFHSHSALSECGYALEHAVLGVVLGHRCSGFFERRRGEYCAKGKSRSFPEEFLMVYEWPSGVHWDCYRLSGSKMAWRHQISPVTKVKRVPLAFVARLFTDGFWDEMGWKGTEKIKMEGVAEWYAFWHKLEGVSEVRPCISRDEVRHRSAAGL